MTRGQRFGARDPGDACAAPSATRWTLGSSARSTAAAWSLRWTVHHSSQSIPRWKAFRGARDRIRAAGSNPLGRPFGRLRTGSRRTSGSQGRSGKWLVGGGEWLVTRVGVGLGGVGGASRGRGRRMMAMRSMPATPSVQALLAVQTTLAGMAVAATHWWAGTALGRMPDGAGGSTVGAYYRRSQVPGCARSGPPGVYLASADRRRRDRDYPPAVRRDTHEGGPGRHG